MCSGPVYVLRYTLAPLTHITVPFHPLDAGTEITLKPAEDAFGKIHCERTALPHFTMDDAHLDRFDERPKGNAPSLSSCRRAGVSVRSHR